MCPPPGGRTLLRSRRRPLRQEKKADDPAAAKLKRTVYVVQHGSAKDLAEALTKHFKSDKDVQILAEPASNCLLINAPDAASDELLPLLRQLDRRPQLVSVEVTVLELSPSKPDDNARDLDEKDLSGPTETVTGKGPGAAEGRPGHRAQANSGVGRSNSSGRRPFSVR